MLLKQQIQEHMKAAMRAKDSRQLGTIRLLLAAIKQREVDERITLGDDQIFVVINKMIKQRRDSLEQYQAAKRQDLADQEAYEISVLERYLPAQLSDEEINQSVQQAIVEVDAKSMKDMSKVMAILKPKLQGRANMANVSTQVKTLLAAKS